MVKYIKYQGEQYPVKIGYRVLKNLQKEGVDLSAVKEDLTVYETLLFYALQAGTKIEGEEMPFSRDQMEDLLDEVFEEFVGIVLDFSQNLGTPYSPTERNSQGDLNS